MIPRHYLVPLVLALPVLVVTFAVLAGAALLAQGLGDQGGYRGLLWAAISALMLLVIDAMLLLAALGIKAVSQEDEPPL